MEEAETSRYWCHMCWQTVNPITEIETTIKCPICPSGFVEERSSATTSPENDSPLEFGSDSARILSHWAPILLGIMSRPRNHRQLRRMEFEDNNEEDGNESSQRHIDQDMESTMIMNRLRRRGRRSSAAILQFLQAGMQPHLETDNDSDREEGRRVILINPFNQTILIQGSNDFNGELYNRGPIGSLNDYFMVPGLDLLLQHLAENDPNRYGTPPAGKEVVDALPTVKIEETMHCCVCLDECEVAAEVKEMPCKHKFHSECIVPWMELHSSCPVCWYQLPADDDDSKLAPDVSSNNNSSNQQSTHNINSGEDDIIENGRRFSIPLVWPFSSLFSPSTSQNNGGNSSFAAPSTNAPPTT